MINNLPAVVISLDIGEKRIGVARGLTDIGIALPLTTIPNDAAAPAALQTLCEQEAACAVVVGLPRNLQAEPTAQTAYTESFVKQLQQVIKLPFHWQDEALTSEKAEQELRQRGKPYEKGAVDALAATYILEDYLRDHLQDGGHA